MGLWRMARWRVPSASVMCKFRISGEAADTCSSTAGSKAAFIAICGETQRLCALMHEGVRRTVAASAELRSGQFRIERVKLLTTLHSRHSSLCRYLLLEQHLR